MAVVRTVQTSELRRIESVGGRRLQAIVVETDARATRFWRASDWREQVQRLRFVKG